MIVSCKLRIVFLYNLEKSDYRHGYSVNEMMRNFWLIKKNIILKGSGVRG